MSALTCAEFVELVTDHLEGAMEPATAQRFAEHLALCPGCGTYLAQIRQVISTSGTLTEDDLSPAARGNVLDAFRRWRSAPS